MGLITLNPLTKSAVGSGEEAGHLDYLDGIRGAAAFYVVATHCMIWSGRFFPLPVPNPKVAVDVFMVLSGFLMMHLAQERAAKEQPGTLSMAMTFWARRFFRIAPLYYLVLVAVFAMGTPFNDGYAYLQTLNPKQWVGTFYDCHNTYHLDYTFKNLLLHLSFLFGLLPSKTSSTGLPDWSIGLELQFYAVFPLLFWLFWRIRPLAAGILIGIVTIVINHVYLRLGYPDFPEPSLLLFKLDIFLAGMMVAAANADFPKNPRTATVILMLAVIIAFRHSIFVMLVCLLMFLMMKGAQDGEHLMIKGRKLAGKILGNRVARFMADTSYCVYLVHGFFISIVGAWLYRQRFILEMHPRETFVVFLAITVICSYAVALVAHHLIEKPGVALGRRILSGPRKWPFIGPALANAAPVPKSKTPSETHGRRN